MNALLCGLVTADVHYKLFRRHIKIAQKGELLFLDVGSRLARGSFREV